MYNLKFIRIFFISILILLLIAVGLYFYSTKSHRNIATEKAEYVLTVSELQNEFMQNSYKANLKYSDKTIVIKGKVTTVDLKSHSVIIDQKMYVVLKTSESSDLKMNQLVKLKGRFLGFDDLLEEFKMDQGIKVE